ncbi:MAG: bifunctional 5,10-methylenetetrahydrofolate dehydrogenase/5,10-methenyltetrahydrofolate cyclohydrolase [Bacteroidia bacterium]|nr:bifunctional 5,10-methylenetetrahydrofolate dehydrogenase/5,10-methenyltetrahydrofolate cyclohydrolase [Bacteroidia bacterium]MBP7261807.1 bifunctional 5,10-methylenetetrahydrofolate dehydrogenase/5,10-methenyltetrahydrofolate cyclohydrolase [Bacteroidia bacterium]MBP9180878.1 bifunctional 5,10-methylenetetrahydrofolate dehydrogenase/5,10-methenyltetrahydrofolate cyclohydrolase [Bacteroidia bacterium]MBP9725125.1 bifunctional 5,10-methylenetetrahydrofolate dehydrogenase/5,10-methenyltetrahydr
MQILNGNEVAKALKQEIAKEVSALKNSGKKVPHLAAVLVGNDGASMTYVGAKEKDCEEVGFDSTVLRFSPETTEDDLLKVIHDLNTNPDIDGFIVQLPLPKHINEKRITESIDYKKDVDGFHPMNVGLMFKGLPCFLPATPFGIIKLLEHYKIETNGKHCVVIGRSDIVGKPMSALMLQKNCTVTVCHSRTVDIEKHIQQADIIIAAVGIPEYLKANMMKEGAVVVDVGITRVDAPGSSKGYVLKGDVAYEECAAKASWITPVPGGVGPMTRVGLLLNTLNAVKLR